MPGTAQEILAILVADKHISQSQADEVSTQSLSSGVAVEDIIRKKHLIPEIDYVKAKAKSLGIPFITLAGRAIAPEVANFIPEPVVRRYTLIPFEINNESG